MNLLTVPNTENLFLEIQFMSRKIYAFLIKSMFVCYVKNILKLLSHTNLFSRIRIWMWVSWSQEIKFDSNKKKGRITNKISDGKKRVGEGVFWVFFPLSQKNEATALWKVPKSSSHVLFCTTFSLRWSFSFVAPWRLKTAVLIKIFRLTEIQAFL